MPTRDYIQHSAPKGFRPGSASPQEFPAQHKQFQHHSSVNMGSVLRSTAKMMLAGWLIEKFELKEPLHKSLAWAATGIGIGYVESLMKQRKDQESDKKVR